MKYMRRIWVMAIMTVLAAGLGFPVIAERPVSSGVPSVDVVYGTSGLSFNPRISFSSVEIYVSAPDGTVVSRKFESGTPFIGLSDFKNAECVDGQYNYELRVVVDSPGNLPRGESSLQNSRSVSGSFTFSGTFQVVNGSVIAPGRGEEIARTNDVLHNDDVIITGNLCVGFDCTEDLGFGSDTFILKENNLRILFDDTSDSSFPAVDWRLVANDTTSGGASYFAIQDVTNSKIPITIEADSRDHSLYVDSAGRIGIGTSVPVLPVHVVKGDTPSVRLDQDTSSGWTAQVWDVAGNESNFFIRDTTNGSKLPFRIQPGTPSNTLALKSTGKVGIGTWSPEQNLEIEATGSNPVLGIQRTDGVSAKLLCSTSQFQLGTSSNHPIKFLINGATAMSLNTNSYLGVGINPTYPLHLASGAYCTAGGVWTNASSITLKENIEPLTKGEAETALRELKPVKFNYIANKSENHVGFIAEDVPELVAEKDRKGLSPMDVTAVLTRVLQDQQKLIRDQQEAIDALKKEVEELKHTIQKD